MISAISMQAHMQDIKHQNQPELLYHAFSEFKNHIYQYTHMLQVQLVILP